jgi:hypothetical protein
MKPTPQFDVTTMLTPAFNHLVGLDFVCCVKKVRKLIDHPVVSLRGTRMGGTSTEMITQCIYLKVSASANRKAASCFLDVFEFIL